MNSHERRGAQTPTEIARILAESYPQASGIGLLFVRLRPYVCPFGKLLAKMPKSGSFLDVGCGIGIMSMLLARVNAVTRVVGFDTSRKAIDTARGAVFPPTTRAEFHCLSPEDAWPDEQFDNVVCVDVLHHVPFEEQRHFVRRLARANFRHAIYFTDVSPRPRWKAWANRFHDLVVRQELIHIRTEREVLQWFEEDGLVVSGPRRMNTLWYPHYCLVASRPSS